MDRISPEDAAPATSLYTHDPLHHPHFVDLTLDPVPSSGAGAAPPVRAWLDHVAAGRIGTPAPEPAGADGDDFRCRSLERILGIRSPR